MGIRIIISMLLCCISFLLKAQNGISNLPSLIPPSPDVASLTLLGELSATNYTGAASVTVPLYTIQTGGIEVPVQLSYSSNGIKVNDIPSRVGLGWNLLAGGMISKIIHDEDDLDPQTVQLAPPSSFTPGFELRDDYYFFADKEGYDTEPDEYSFSAGNLNGKFFLDDNGVSQLQDKAGLKVEKVLNGFHITLPNGIKYFFDDKVEKTQDAKINNLTRNNKIKTTAWFLSKITAPDGKVVYFEYTPISTKSFLGPSQSANLVKVLPNYSGSTST